VIDVQVSPAGNELHRGLPGAGNEPSDAAFLRGSAANLTKSGVQRRIDKLVGERYALRQANEHLITEIAELRQSNAELTLALAKAERLISRYKGALLKRT